MSPKVEQSWSNVARAILQHPDYSNNEIASFLGVTKGTVAGILARGKARFGSLSLFLKAMGGDLVEEKVIQLAVANFHARRLSHPPRSGPPPLVPHVGSPYQFFRIGRAVLSDKTPPQEIVPDTRVGKYKTLLDVPPNKCTVPFGSGHTTTFCGNDLPKGRKMCDDHGVLYMRTKRQSETPHTTKRKKVSV